MDAFDADVLIYAGILGHPLGTRVRGVLDRPQTSDEHVGVGSVLLINETLVKPTREQRHSERAELINLLARLRLRDVDAGVAEHAVTLAAKYGLKTVDAVHLATAVLTGADRFITNNRRDFDQTTITEIDVTYPDDLIDSA